MSHTLKVIAGGFGLLAVCLLAARLISGGSSSAIAFAIKAFLLLWLVAAGINLWIGVTKAGYSVREELPIFGVVFVIPALVAVSIWCLVARGQAHP